MRYSREKQILRLRRVEREEVPRYARNDNRCYELALASEFEKVGGGFALVEIGPFLREVIAVRHGEDEAGHMARSRRLQAGDLHDLEHEWPREFGNGCRAHLGLIAFAAIVDDVEVVAIEGVESEHFGFVARLETLH